MVNHSYVQKRLTPHSVSLRDNYVLSIVCMYVIIGVSEYWGLTPYQYLGSYHSENKVLNLGVTSKFNGRGPQCAAA